MGHYEDSFYEIHSEIKEKGLINQFQSQLDKMRFQDKHKYKSTKDMWEYAHHKVTSSYSPENNLEC